MLTSKQRAHLRSLANPIDTILIIGKSGVGEQVLKQTEDALKSRELIKGKVLETSDLSPKEVANLLAEDTKSEVIQVIGSKFVLYKRNKKKPKIKLPRAIKD